MKLLKAKTYCFNCAYSKLEKSSLWCLLHKDYYFSVESTCSSYMDKSKKVVFGVLNPHTKKVIPIATSLFSGILWLNELARIFPNKTSVIIMKGKSDVKTFGDLRKLENSTKIFIQ